MPDPILVSLGHLKNHITKNPVTPVMTVTRGRSLMQIPYMQPFTYHMNNNHSSLSRCSSLVKTTCLLVSSISPARKTSSRIAYTCTNRRVSVLSNRQRCAKFRSAITNLVEIENQVQLAHVAEELIQDLDKEMDCLEVC